MTVALLNPNLHGPAKLRWTGEHLGLGYLAASVAEAGHPVGIVDGDLLDLDPEEELESIAALEPDLLGVSITEDNAEHAVPLLRRLRESLPGVPICVGGHMVSALSPEELGLWAIDFVCRGEGETPFRRLADALRDGAPTHEIPGIGGRENGLVAPPRHRPEDLDSLPLPLREHTRTAMRLGFPPFVSSSRGCYARCRFCSISAFYAANGASGWRARSPEGVVDEIVELHEATGCERVVLVDDNFIGPAPHGPDRARAIASLLLRRRRPVRFSISCRVVDIDQELFTMLAGAGLENVFLGLESFESEVLRRLGKGTTPEANLRALELLGRLGISANPSLIMFTPWGTPAGMLKALDALETHLDSFDISILLSRLWPLNGTRFESMAGSGSRPVLQCHDPGVAALYRVVERHSDEIFRLNNSLNQQRKLSQQEATAIGRPQADIEQLYESFQLGLRSLLRASLQALVAAQPLAPPSDELAAPWDRFVAGWRQEVEQVPPSTALQQRSS